MFTKQCRSPAEPARGCLSDLMKHPSMPDISVIVSTFDRPDALAAVLRGLAAQCDMRFEIIVGDDGSGPETARCIGNARDDLSIPVRHVWHANSGFRVAEIRNRAVTQAQGAYLILLDGDCIPRAHFVERHRRLAERGWVVSGSRVLLSRKATEQILSDEIAVETWPAARWLHERLTRRTNRLLPLVGLPDGRWRKVRAGDWRPVRSCNLAMWRDDLMRLDGFDSSYTGWGLEDSDLAIRALRAGLRHKSGRFATAVIHLWHPKGSADVGDANGDRFERLILSNRIKAERGLSHIRAHAAPGQGPHGVCILTAEPYPAAPRC